MDAAFQPKQPENPHGTCGKPVLLGTGQCEKFGDNLSTQCLAGRFMSSALDPTRVLINSLSMEIKMKLIAALVASLFAAAAFAQAPAAAPAKKDEKPAAAAPAKAEAKKDEKAAPAAAKKDEKAAPAAKKEEKKADAKK